MKRRKIPELTVGAFIINNSGDVLLVQSPKWSGGRYSIPGGHVEYGESIFEAVKREAYEEVGLRVKPVALYMVQEVINPKEFHESERHFIFFDVLCRALTTDVKIDNTEITGYTWVKPRKALKLRLEKYTRNLLSAYVTYGSKVRNPIVKMARG